MAARRMSNPVVGFRFRPTNEEIVDYYLRLKNLGDGSSTSDVDQIISTVNICNFDPWDLPSQSKTESIDLVWYFFGLKENKYNKGERQSRKTKSGFWKKTGVTTEIMRKRGGKREKIGEKRVLVFHFSKQSKSKWVMHEYHATFLSSNQMMTYTICKVEFKGDAREMSSYPGSEVEHSDRSSIAHVNNSSRFEGLPLKSQKIQNPCHFTSFHGLDADFNNQLCDDQRSLILIDDDEHSKIVYMPEHCDDHIPLEVPRMNNSVGSEGMLFKSQSQELHNPCQFTGFIGLDTDYHNQLSDDWRSLLVNDDEQSKIDFMQEHCNDHIPQKTLTGVFMGHSNDGEPNSESKKCDWRA